MSQFDLFGFGGDPLQQRLNRPGFALARAFPKQGGSFFGCTLRHQRGIKALLESQAIAGHPCWIAGLSRRPAESVSWFEPGLRIPGFPWFESSVPRHLDPLLVDL